MSTPLWPELAYLGQCRLVQHCISNWSDGYHIKPPNHVQQDLKHELNPPSSIVIRLRDQCRGSGLVHVNFFNIVPNYIMCIWCSSGKKDLEKFRYL